MVEGRTFVAAAEPPAFDVAFPISPGRKHANDRRGHDRRRRPSDSVGSRDIEITRNQPNVQIASEKCERATQFPGRYPPRAET